MQVSAWSNGKGTYGLRVGEPNRERFFRDQWDEIYLEIEGEMHRVGLTGGFWEGCPEIRDPVLREWLRRHRSLQWPRGHPPRAELVPLGGNRFRLLP